MGTKLPIDDVMPELLAVLGNCGVAVLQAPPGAGKTTRVPLALLDQIDGKIVMLEPRRIAARSAANRLASNLGEVPGQRVGYAMRGEVKRGSRIEVVTEGILTRMLQTEPDLPGVGAVIFDEFHERSLAADLGLALAWEARETLRPDLAILVMSATLDAGKVAAMLGDAPVVTSDGRSFPVDIIWADAPRPARDPVEHAAAEMVLTALAETDGGILCFLPGEAEIRRTVQRLEQTVPKGIDLRPLYGALPFSAQQAAIAPSARRKVVLSTSIAETSLTIEDIRVVVDAGLARRARFDAARGMGRLVTERASKAEAEQRAGRAGRVAPGTCYRLWTKGEHGARVAQAPPEIETADLTGLALECANWGSSPEQLRLLSRPPAGAFGEALDLLSRLGALDSAGRVTDFGRRLAAFPLHPRLARMIALGGTDAAPLAALLSDRDPLATREADVGLRLKAIARPTAGEAPGLKRLREDAKRLGRLASDASCDTSTAKLAALAFPDRIAKRRPGGPARYLMTSGTGAALDDADGLATSPYLVVCEATGSKGADAHIRLALPISETEIRDVSNTKIETVTRCAWSKRMGVVEARRQERLGQIVLSDVPWSAAPEDAIAQAMCDGVRQLGLNFSSAARRLCDRVSLVRGKGVELPDFSSHHLLATLEDWLLPHLAGVRNAAAWTAFDAHDALKAQLSWEQIQTLDRLAPTHFKTPTGSRIKIDYRDGQPAASVRLQEMFGLDVHPTIGAAHSPLKLTLLSPARRPLQVTQDLPGFWRGSYSDVRKDMRARYPKHPWPEDPISAEPTTRTKSRK